MTVGDLKNILSGLPDELVVMIPLEEDMFISPCVEESGVEDLLLDDDEKEEATLVLVPCGYYADVEEEIDPQMN